MKARYQIYILVSILLMVGIGLSAYKYFVLGFTLTPDETETVWQIQGRIEFEAEGGPAKVVMVLPSTEQSYRQVFKEVLSNDFQYNVIEEGGVRKAVWTRSDAQGTQVLFIRGDLFQIGALEQPKIDSEVKPQSVLEGPLRMAGENLLQKARGQATTDLALVIKVLELMEAEEQDSDAQLLLEDVHYRHERLEQVAQILALEGIHAKVIRGLRLQGNYTQRSITSFLDIFAEERWVLLDTKELIEIPYSEALLWPAGTHGLLDVYGGKNSRIDISVSSSQQNTGRLAVAEGKFKASALIDFSIYSLPIRDQNTFKLLLLIPLGALVVVILRNLVGIRTSGTFMPILIALTFMQTNLLLGLLLFLTVVSVGLIMRSYLSHLNLLLVPRIASVLVFVIIIFAAIGILSHKIGWESGLAITYFPMIILSWTIERMCVLWEEDGPKEVLVQGGGSLLTASLAYLLMVQPNVEHLAFNFPELLLVLLAIIIMIGTYSGFRLLELFRFEPMTRE